MLGIARRPQGKRPNGGPGPEILAETISLEDLGIETLSTLRRQAATGSVLAAREIQRIVRDKTLELQAAACADHFDREKVEQWMLRQFEIWQRTFEGGFCDRAAVELSVDIYPLRDLVLDACEDVAKELNVDPEIGGGHAVDREKEQDIEAS